MAISSIVNPGFPPALIFLLGAAFVPLLRGKAKAGFMLLVPAVTFAVLVSIPYGCHWSVDFLDYQLILGRVDRLSFVFGFIFTIISFLSLLFALNIKDDLHHVSGLCYAGGALGVVFAGDLFSLYVFWEIMAVASTFLILTRRTEQARSAAYRYILVHIFGGLCLLAGILLYFQKTGSLEFAYIGLEGPATWLILAGIALNAAIPPLHAWLPDAYSEATFAGAVFLSAFTTKSAVYVLARAFAGTNILIVLGVIMALYGVVYAVLENDHRRLLSYHVISQVGYMVAGVGIGTKLALNGTVAHAYAHILYKGLLFMGCGSVLYMTGKNKFTELGGLYKKMPWTFLFTLIGGLSISAFPLFSGFVSKSIIVAASYDDHLYWAAFLLLIASSGTFLHTGLKVPYFIWFGKNNCTPETWQKAKDPSWNMLAAMAITSILCVFTGIYYTYLYNMLPFSIDYQPYNAYHLMETMQVLLFTGLGFFLFLKKLSPEAMIAIDTDWFYRKGAKWVYIAFDVGLNSLNAACERALNGFCSALAIAVRDLPARLVLIVLTNLWLAAGYSGKRLELVKRKTYNDVMVANTPVGIGAGLTALFVVVFFVLANFF